LDIDNIVGVGVKALMILMIAIHRLKV